jgi:hypothetical protein
MDSLKRIGFLFLLCRMMLPAGSLAGEPLTLELSEIRLKEMFARIAAVQTDQEKLTIADSIADLLNRTLQLPGSINYPFRALSMLGKIASHDQQVRIFTWNVPGSDGSNRYYGFLQHQSRNTAGIFRLNDMHSSVTDPAMTDLTPDKWYGCLIYEIIEKKTAGITCYTLLGYNPENLFVSEKIVDVLWFNDQHEPVFGKAIFHYQKRIQNRIVFEYSAKVTMSLTWNDKMDMIVYDHLSPAKPSYAGNYQYYGPDLSFDGLSFEKGIWETVEDIDVRNSNE